MTARIVDLAKWREDHPPIVRLAHITGHLMMASFAFQRNAWRAWLSLFIMALRIKVWKLSHDD